MSASPSDPITLLRTPVAVDYEVHAGATTGQFLRGVLERRLLGRRCPRCARVYVPPRGACPTCGVPMADEVEVGQRGTITTFSVVRIPFEGQVLPPPYVCASVLLDGADVPVLHIVADCDCDAVRVGMRVEAVWGDPAPTLASLRYFRPSGEPDAAVEAP